MAIELSIETQGAPEGLNAFLDAVLEVCCEVEGIASADCAGRLGTDDMIQSINRDFRGIDTTTDVLSFPSIDYPRGKTAKDSAKRLKRERNPETGRVYLGDFVLSLSRAQAQADQFGHSLLRELGYLTAHSMFHLMGYDHMTEDDKRVMRQMEERAMEKLRLNR